MNSGDRSDLEEYVTGIDDEFDNMLGNFDDVSTIGSQDDLSDLISNINTEIFVNPEEEVLKKRLTKPLKKKTRPMGSPSLLDEIQGQCEYIITFQFLYKRIQAPIISDEVYETTHNKILKECQRLIETQGLARVKHFTKICINRHISIDYVSANDQEFIDDCIRAMLFKISELKLTKYKKVINGSGLNIRTDYDENDFNTRFLEVIAVKANLKFIASLQPPRYADYFIPSFDNQYNEILELIGTEEFINGVDYVRRTSHDVEFNVIAEILGEDRFAYIMNKILVDYLGSELNKSVTFISLLDELGRDLFNRVLNDTNFSDDTEDGKPKLSQFLVLYNPSDNQSTEDLSWMDNFLSESGDGDNRTQTDDIDHEYFVKYSLLRDEYKNLPKEDCLPKGTEAGWVCCYLKSDKLSCIICNKKYRTTPNGHKPHLMKYHPKLYNVININMYEKGLLPGNRAHKIEQWKVSTAKYNHILFNWPCDCEECLKKECVEEDNTQSKKRKM